MFSGYKPLNTWGSLFSHITWKLLVPHKLQKFSHENLFGSVNRFLYKTAVVLFFFSSFPDTLNAFISLSVINFLFSLSGPFFFFFFLMLCIWKTNDLSLGCFFRVRATTPSVISYCGFCLKLAHVRIEESGYIIQLKSLVIRCLLGTYCVQDTRLIMTQKDVDLLSILWNTAKMQFVIS